MSEEIETDSAPTKSQHKRRKQVAPWPNEDTRKLIELIEAHDCLWNVEKSSFKNKYSRSAAWDDISKEMSREVDDCLAKWNALRTNYRVSKNTFKFLNSKCSVRK